MPDRPTTGLVDCGNWAVSASWTVPGTAVSGVYIAHLIRNDTGGASQIVFVVRNDASHSDIIFQTSDTTWQAYNTYGGNSLYTCTVSLPARQPAGLRRLQGQLQPAVRHAATTRGATGSFYTEYPMIRFLEANGYDVSYISGRRRRHARRRCCSTTRCSCRGPRRVLVRRQRTNVEAARDAGVNLAFFSGNEVFWKTRWEPSIDGTNTPYRTLVTYKETHFNAPTDPRTHRLDRQLARSALQPAGRRRPARERADRQLFIVNAGTTDIQVPAQYAQAAALAQHRRRHA